ncbi:hypothetical protein EV421DRAFT_1908279 [Armillaria borealis]|uniref:Uncharacterized protein n=1 Tax=Armillaria borealis TaxID=47425 RepID=A0AA39J5F2_9AGAR|nr:hypothetical protein EV421DRAFT_1908279 [Armillaria borealis]
MTLRGHGAWHAIRSEDYLQPPCGHGRSLLGPCAVTNTNTQSTKSKSMIISPSKPSQSNSFSPSPSPSDHSSDDSIEIPTFCELLEAAPDGLKEEFNFAEKQYNSYSFTLTKASRAWLTEHFGEVSEALPARNIRRQVFRDISGSLGSTHQSGIVMKIFKNGSEIDYLHVVQLVFVGPSGVTEEDCNEVEHAEKVPVKVYGRDADGRWELLKPENRYRAYGNHTPNNIGRWFWDAKVIKETIINDTAHNSSQDIIVERGHVYRQEPIKTSHVSAKDLWEDLLESNIRLEIQRNDSEHGQFPTSLYDPTDPKTMEEHNRAQALVRHARARAREDEASGQISKRARLVE